MESADLQPQEPTAGQAEQSAAPAEPSAQPTAGESGRADQADRGQVAQGMNAFLRGTLGTDQPASSKPAEGAEPGESAPQGDVEAGQARERGADGKFLPRRGAPEAIKSQQDEIADLKRQLSDRDPEKLRQQWENERTVREATDTEAAQARADAEKYERLRDAPDRNLSDEDYRWREDYKAALDAAPVAVRKANALAERAIAAGQQKLDAERDGFFNTVAGEVMATAKEYGFDADAWKPGTGATFRSMAKDVVEHVAAPLRERIAELERELHSSRTVGPNGFGTLRVPALSGASNGGAKPSTMNDWLRGG